MSTWSIEKFDGKPKLSKFVEPIEDDDNTIQQDDDILITESFLFLGGGTMQ